MMTRNCLAPMVALCLGGMLACAQDVRSLSDDERSEIEAGVRAAVNAFRDAQLRRDPDAVLPFLAPDFYMYVDGNRADYETVSGQIRSTMTSLQGMETTWSDVEVMALGRDHALVSFVFRDVVTDGEGVTSRLRGPTTLVWRFRDGVWQILSADADHYPDS